MNKILMILILKTKNNNCNDKNNKVE